MQKLLQELQGNKNRAAHFKTVMALIINGQEYLFEGSINGKIISEKIGANGFGYDPIFLVPEMQQTFSEILPEVKAKISHRAKALAILRSKLTSLVGSHYYSA